MPAVKGEDNLVGVNMNEEEKSQVLRELTFKRQECD